MKRHGNLFKKVINIQNLEIADKKARKGKLRSLDVKFHDKNKGDNIVNLYYLLKNKEYKTSQYEIFDLKEYKKIRKIYKLPYYPDRILHHALMNILEPIFTRIFIKNTYSCIKKRGIHKALRDLNIALKNKPIYCLKLDIKQYYPSINNEILKSLLRKKFKDNDLLWLLDEIIDSTVGLPIGNYSSQILANFYLTYFDHWIKEDKHVKNYFRYMDDIVILSNNKKELHELLSEIREYLKINLKLEIKSNYQIFPIIKRGIDFVGYVSFYDYIKLRKRIKKQFIRMIKKYPNRGSIASYWGWIYHCNGKNLWEKYVK